MSTSSSSSVPLRNNPSDSMFPLSSTTASSQNQINQNLATTTTNNTPPSNPSTNLVSSNSSSPQSDSSSPTFLNPSDSTFKAENTGFSNQEIPSSLRQLSLNPHSLLDSELNDQTSPRYGFADINLVRQLLYDIDTYKSFLHENGLVPLFNTSYPGILQHQFEYGLFLPQDSELYQSFLKLQSNSLNSKLTQQPQQGSQSQLYSNKSQSNINSQSLDSGNSELLGSSSQPLLESNSTLLLQDHLNQQQGLSGNSIGVQNSVPIQQAQVNPAISPNQSESNSALHSQIHSNSGTQISSPTSLSKQSKQSKEKSQKEFVLKAIGAYAGHSDGIWSIEVAPWKPYTVLSDVNTSTTLFGTASADHTAALWLTDLQMKSESETNPHGKFPPIVASLVGHSGAVKGIKFHPSKPIIATCAGDGRLLSWKIEPLLFLNFLAQTDNSLSNHLSSFTTLESSDLAVNHPFVMNSSFRPVQLEPFRRYSLPHDPKPRYASPWFNYLSSFAPSSVPSFGLDDLCFMKGGSQIASCSSRGDIFIHDLTRPEVSTVFQSGHRINYLSSTDRSLFGDVPSEPSTVETIGQLSDDSLVFSAGSNGVVSIWDLRTNKRCSVLGSSSPSISVTCAKVYNNGSNHQIIVASFTDRTLKAFDMANPQKPLFTVTTSAHRSGIPLRFSFHPFIPSMILVPFDGKGGKLFDISRFSDESKPKYVRLATPTSCMMLQSQWITTDQNKSYPLICSFSNNVYLWDSVDETIQSKILRMKS